jgi:hypothetical protein
LTTARSIIKLSREALKQSEKKRKIGTCTESSNNNKLYYKYQLTQYDKSLLKKQDPAEAYLSWRDYGYWTRDKLEIFPLDRVELEKPWSSGKSERVRRDIESGIPLSPIRLHQNPDGGHFQISDGIHRANVSIEFGFTHIPAIVSYIRRDEPRGVNAQKVSELEMRDEASLLWNKIRFEFGDLAYLKVDFSVDNYILYVEHWMAQTQIEKQIEFHVNCRGLDRILTIVLDSSVFLRNKRFADFDKMVRYTLQVKQQLIG